MKYEAWVVPPRELCKNVQHGTSCMYYVLVRVTCTRCQYTCHMYLVPVDGLWTMDYRENISQIRTFVPESAQKNLPQGCVVCGRKFYQQVAKSLVLGSNFVITPYLVLFSTYVLCTVYLVRGTVYTCTCALTRTPRTYGVSVQKVSPQCQWWMRKPVCKN